MHLFFFPIQRIFRGLFRTYILLALSVINLIGLHQCPPSYIVLGDGEKAADREESIIAVIMDLAREEEKIGSS